jgi:hypothetical protein
VAKAIGVLAIAGCGILIFVAARATASQRPQTLILCAIFALPMLFLPLEFYFRRIEFDEREIVIYCAWRSERRIPWTEVVSFVHLPRQKEWILETKNHGKIKLSMFLQGLHDLQAAAVKQGKGA